MFGQPDFNSSLAGVLAGPHLISLDSNDQLYIADTGNNRIAVLPSVPTAGNNPAVLFSIAGLSNPYGVFVDPGSGGIWVTNTGGNQVLRICERRGGDREREAQRDAQLPSDRSRWRPIRLAIR